MIGFMLGTLLIFVAFVLSTWMFAVTRKLLWLANPTPHKGRYHHGMVFDEETGLAKSQCKPVYGVER